MLKDTDKVRLDAVLRVIRNNNLRFPNSDIAAKLGRDKGNVSKMLTGKIPISDDFYQAFMGAYGNAKITYKGEAMAYTETVAVDLIRLKASDKVLRLWVAELSAHLKKSSYASEIALLEADVQAEIDKVFAKPKK